MMPEQIQKKILKTNISSIPKKNVELVGMQNYDSQFEAMLKKVDLEKKSQQQLR